MNNDQNTSYRILIICGIVGIFLIDYRVDPLWYGLAWLFIVGGAFGLYQNKK